MATLCVMKKWTPDYKSLMRRLHLVESRRGVGEYCFWCRSHRRPRSFLSSLYLLNQWVDFDQTCTDIIGRGGKKWLDFGDLDLIFKHFEILTKMLVCTHLLNQMTVSDQTSYVVTLGWFKDLIRFLWPWPNFQGHHTIKTDIFKFWPKKACLHPVSWTKWQILAKIHILQCWDGLKIWLDFGDLIFSGDI